MLIQVFNCDAELMGCWEQRESLTNEQAIALADKDLIPVEIIGNQAVEYEFEYDFEADKVCEVKRIQRAIATSLDSVIELSGESELSLEGLFATADEIMDKPIYQS